MKNNLFILGIAATIGACNLVNNADAKLETKLDSVSYSLGISVAESVKAQGLDAMNAQSIAAAFNDVFEENDLQITDEEATVILQEYFMELSQKKNQESISEGQNFLDENASNEGVVTTQSGLQYTVLSEGQGNKPTPSDKVTVHYHGTLLDGTVFDSSVDRGEPVTFPVIGVIPGWTESLQLMQVGSKWNLVIPSELAYGEGGIPQAGIGPNSTLYFEVELLKIN